MQILKDGRIADHKKIFPNTSFPSSGPSDSFLTSQGAYKVVTFRDYDRATQKLVGCAPVIENGLAYVVEVQSKSADDLAADVASKAAQVRSARDAALKASDWTQVADAPVDKAAWATYRQSLRDLPNAEGWPNVDLPHDPDWVDPNA